MINICRPSELTQMRKTSKLKLKKDIIGSLPPEISRQVLSNLAPKDLAHSMMVNRTWLNVAKDNLLWKMKCKEADYQLELGKR